MGHLEKQFNIELLSKKTGTKKFSSFRKSQNHLKNHQNHPFNETKLLLLMYEEIRN